MTTAHRATWKAARGGLQEEGSFRLHVPSAAVSSKDAPTERALKTRDAATAAAQAHASREELREHLEGAEGNGAPSSSRDAAGERPKKRLRSRFGALPAGEGAALGGVGPDRQPLLLNGRATNVEGGDGVADCAEAPALLDGAVDHRASAQDANECATAEEGNAVVAVSDGNKSKAAEAEAEAEEAGDDSGDESDSSSEDEAELLAEVERIRKEREFERAKKQAEEHERQQREEEQRVATSNPLLPNIAASVNDEISETASVATASVAFSVRRRWDDDVIFRSQAGRERSNGARFINDTIHNDFHKRFMKRYMR